MLTGYRAGVVGASEIRDPVTRVTAGEPASGTAQQSLPIAYATVGMDARM